MSKWIPACMLLLLLAACGSSQTRSDSAEDDHYTQDDLASDTDGVYRPGNSGKDDDGVRKDKSEPARTTVEKKDEPKSEPKNEPAKQPQAEPKTHVEKPKQDPEPKAEPKTDDKAKQAHDIRLELMGRFISKVGDEMDTLKDSKAWKDLLKVRDKFNDRTDKALEKGRSERGKDVENAWAEAIKAWYEVRYMQLLFMHLNQKSGSDFEPGAGLNFDELEDYTNDQLSSDKCIRTTAAFELTESELRDVRKFQTDVLKYDLVAGKVFTDEDYAKKWKSEKKKWQDAASGKFDSSDLKKYE